MPKPDSRTRRPPSRPRFAGSPSGRPRPPAGRSSAGRTPPGADRIGSGVEVHVVDRQRVMRVDAGWFEALVRSALGRQGIGRAVVSVVLVDDRRMAALHRRWLEVDGPTDVITFDLSAGGPGGIEGDVVVSTETARRVAREVGWSARHEAAYYVVHGLLHLAGYDDHDAAARRTMRTRERVLLAAAGLPPPPRRGGRGAR